MRVPSLAAATALALTLVACTGDAPPDDAAADPTPSPDASASAEATPSPETRSEPAAVDPTVVPPVEEMTVAYVEAVVNAIEARSGELFAQVLAEPVNPIGALPDGVAEGLEALYDGDRLQFNVAEVELLAGSEEARDLVLPAEAYRGIRYELVQVSYADDGCLVAVGRIDRSGTRRDSESDGVLSFVSMSRAGNADARNPTPWTIVDSISNTDSAGAPNDDDFAFSATLDDFEGALTHSCAGESSRVG